MAKRYHHSDVEKIKIVSTENSVLIHPINRYILDWEISDQLGMKTVWTQQLARLCKTQIYHDQETESLIIPALSLESYNSLRDYKPNQAWYETPSLGPVINVDLWLIPPFVLAMLMAKKRDSDLVTHQRVKVVLSTMN